jgi:hypothetical protein
LILSGGEARAAFNRLSPAALSGCGLVNRWANVLAGRHGTQLLGPRRHSGGEAGKFPPVQLGGGGSEIHTVPAWTQAPAGSIRGFVIALGLPLLRNTVKNSSISGAG